MRSAAGLAEACEVGLHDAVGGKRFQGCVADGGATAAGGERYGLWTDRYDRPFDDLPMVPDDIAVEVAKALKLPAEFRQP